MSGTVALFAVVVMVPSRSVVKGAKLSIVKGTLSAFVAMTCPSCWLFVVTIPLIAISTVTRALPKVRR